MSEETLYDFGKNRQGTADLKVRRYDCKCLGCTMQDAESEAGSTEAGWSDDDESDEDDPTREEYECLGGMWIRVR